MTTKSQRTPQKLIWMLRIPLILALLTTLFLMLAVLLGLESFVDECCGSLIDGKWAFVFTLPVSLIGAVVYTCALISTLSEIRRTTLTRTFLVFFASVIAGAAIWFTAIQIYKGQFCPICTTIHTAGLVFATIVFAKRRHFARKVNVLQTVLFGMAAVVALAISQILSPEVNTSTITESSLPLNPAPAKPSPTPPGEGEEGEENAEPAPPPIPVFDPDPAAVGKANPDQQSPSSDTPSPPHISGPGVHHGGLVVINPSAVPFVGDVSAPFTITKFFDYTCASCRDSHGDLEKLLKAYPGKFRILLVPCPLNSRCNAFVSRRISENHTGACELASYALAIWYSAPEKFPEYHDFLMEERLPADVSRAKKEAERLVDPAKLNSAETTAWVESRLEATFADYALLRQGSIRFPKLLLDEKTIIHGTPSTTESFLRTMAKHFDLQYPPPSN